MLFRRERAFCILAVTGWTLLANSRWGLAQSLEPAPPSSIPNPLSDPTINLGKTLLFDLEARFAKDVLARGGAAFADWFAEDGVAMSNGAAPLIGRVAIAKSATWSPKAYQLTWVPTAAVMGPSGDMGYTWGHFEGHSTDANGNPVTTSGRYTTILEETARRGVEGSAGCGEQRSRRGRRLLQVARGFVGWPGHMPCL